MDEYIEDIYFFEVNAKYISSNVLTISVISRVHSTSATADIFNISDEIFFIFTSKKKKKRKKQEKQHSFNFFR